MGNVAAVHVLDALDELLGVVLNNGHGQSGLVHKEVKDLSPGHKLCRNVAYSRLDSVFIRECCLLSDIGQADNVLVIQLRVIRALIREHPLVVFEYLESALATVVCVSR